MKPLTPEILSEIMKGEIAHLSILLAQEHLTIQACAALLPPLLLRKEAVKKILTDYHEEKISSQSARSWASFIKRGYIAGGTDPIAPLEINYEHPHEDLISEILYRLDELGDEIDGEMTKEEIDEFCELLQKEGRNSV